MLLSAELLPLRGTRWEIYAGDVGNNPQNEENGIKFLVSVSRPNIKFILSHKEPRPGPLLHRPTHQQTNLRTLLVCISRTRKTRKSPKSEKNYRFSSRPAACASRCNIRSDFCSQVTNKKKRTILAVLTPGLRRQNKTLRAEGKHELTFRDLPCSQPKRNKQVPDYTTLFVVVSPIPRQ